jgi:mxaD protein
MNTIIRNSIGAAGIALAASSFAAGSLSVAREAVVDRSPATVWKLLGEFNSLDVWLPPVMTSTFTGHPTKPGAIRVLGLGGDASVTEKLLAYDGARHSYSYAFIESPLPVKNYVATIELSPAPDGKTLVKWHGSFDAAGAPDDKAKEAIQGIYDAGLTKLAAIFRK